MHRKKRTSLRDNIKKSNEKHKAERASNMWKEWATIGVIVSQMPKMEEKDQYDIVCYTDGSASPTNPGPCGAGLVVMLPNGMTHEQHMALGHGTNNIGEVMAIQMALSFALKHLCIAAIENKESLFLPPPSAAAIPPPQLMDLVPPAPPILTSKKSAHTLHIYSDSKYAIGAISKNWNCKENVKLINTTKKLMREFKSKTKWKIRFIWVKGHADNLMNERADTLARKGSAEAAISLQKKHC
jgi:ribonuclease HI